MRKQRLSLLLILGLILIIFIASCSPQPSDCYREDVFCVGLVTAYGDVENHGLNQVTWKALQSIEVQAQMARLDNIESVDARDWEKNIRFFADRGYDVIVTVGFNLSEATIEVAKEFTDIFFIGIDQQVEEAYDNVATIYFIEEQAGFLAGVLAAMVTESGKVGAVCETIGIDAVWRYCEGFRAGALNTDNDVQIYVVFREGGSSNDIFNDPEWGEVQALHLIEEGVDILTGYGGNTIRGAFLAASKKDILVIGSEEDLYFQLPDLQPVVVTSIILDPSVALSQLVLLDHQGEISAGSYVGQIGFAPFRSPQFNTETEIQLEMDNILQGIKDGKIKIDLPEKK